MINVIFLDLDGTLLKSDSTLSARTVEALRKCKSTGKRIVIATARPPRTVVAFLPEDLSDGTLICYGGAVVYEGGKRVHSNPVSPAISKHIIEWVQASYPSCRLSVEIDDKLYANKELGQQWTYEIVDLNTLIGKPMDKILVDLSDLDDPVALIGVLPRDCKMLITGDGRVGQIMAASASKTDALRFVLKRWNLTMRNVIAFGDDATDADVIRLSAVGVAVENAIPEVKEVADLVTSSNDEDGVAVVLEEVVLSANDAENAEKSC